MVDNSMVADPIALQQQLFVKFCIRPYMTHVSKPTIEIKHVAKILEHGDVTRRSPLHIK